MPHRPSLVWSFSYILGWIISSLLIVWCEECSYTMLVRQYVRTHTFGSDAVLDARCAEGTDIPLDCHRNQTRPANARAQLSLRPWIHAHTPKARLPLPPFTTPSTEANSPGTSHSSTTEQHQRQALVPLGQLRQAVGIKHGVHGARWWRQHLLPTPPRVECCSHA